MSRPQSPGTVPKGSETFGTVPAASTQGRAPIKTDIELLDLARRLTEKLGRPPRTQELVDQAGGCQRQRAVRAIQTLRTEMAEKAVRSQLLIPAALQEELKTIFVRWMDCAAAQLAETQAEADLKLEEKLEAANDAIVEKNERIGFLQQRLGDVEHLHQEFLAGTDRLNREIDTLRKERDRATALAEERQRLLDTVLHDRLGAVVGGRVAE